MDAVLTFSAAVKKHAAFEANTDRDQYVAVGWKKSKNAGLREINARPY